jgi:hypothetical protein
MASLSFCVMGSIARQYGRSIVKVSQLTFLSEVGGRQNSGHGHVLGHLLQDLDEETNLHLRRLLEQSVERCRSLGLAKDAEPLFNSAQLVLEVLVKSSCRHLFECSFILVDVGEPLLGSAFHLIRVARLGIVAAKVDFGSGANATIGKRGGEAAEIS